MDLWKQQSLFASDLAKLILFVEEEGYSCSVGEVYRTTEQSLLNAKKGTGIINSLHCKKLAADITLFSKMGTALKDVKHYENIGLYWESLDTANRWGGHFAEVDVDHFERKEI